MTDKEHKQAVLKAAIRILKEYKSGTHHCGLEKCQLCIKLYQRGNYNENSCENCPMEIFDKSNRGIGCTYRKCSMIRQNVIHPVREVYEANISRVIDFYEKFIELVRKSKHCRLKTKSGNTSLFARSLLTLDTAIFYKHEKLKENDK